MEQRYYLKYTALGKDMVVGPYEGLREANSHKDDIEGYGFGVTMVPAEDVEVKNRFDHIG